MKNFVSYNLIMLITSISIIFSCSSKNSETAKNAINDTIPTAIPVMNYGKTIQAEDAIEAHRILEMLDEGDSLQLKVEGAITEVCSKKGCWMNMELGNGKTMKVTFKDYGFFVPKDASGQTAIIEGVAKLETTSVETLRHYAEDAGKSKKEILAIVNPEKNIVFKAEGVILK
jgi:uncharacterized protein YjcR